MYGFFLVYKYVKQYKDCQFYDYMRASFNYKIHKLTIRDNTENTRVQRHHQGFLY